MDGKKEPVRIREKELADGTRSLYLDIYVNKKRRYEFLKLYLLPETSREAKAINRRTYELANAVKAKRIVEIQNRRLGFENETSKQTIESFIETIAADENMGKTTRNAYRFLSRCITQCIGEGATLEELEDQESVDEICEFISSRNIKPSTANTYIRKVKRIIHTAYKLGKIKTEITAKTVEKRKEEPSERQYLTMDEIRILAADIKDSEKAKSKDVKRAFIFSCLTGLRYSDISKLTKDMVSTDGGTTRITFKQQKTKELQYLDINEQAAEILQTQIKENGALPFGSVKPSKANRDVKKWATDNGIKKHITFHSARHTFAVMMITLGVDIYTVSKLLGHTSVTTTQIYAKIMDKKRREAVGLIPRMI